MSFHIDPALPPEEKERIFQRIMESRRKEAFEMYYEDAIKRGLSVEEATKVAADNQYKFYL